MSQAFVRIGILLSTVGATFPVWADEPPRDPRPVVEKKEMHVAADEPVGLFEDQPFTPPIKVCDAPCNRTIDVHAGAIYFVDGPGIMASERFSIAGQPAGASLAVDAGSDAHHWTGVGLAIAGIPFAATGCFMPIVLAASNDSEPEHVTALIIVDAVAVSLLVPAIVLGITEGTDVEWVEPVQAQPSPARGRDARTRERKPRYWRGEF